MSAFDLSIYLLKFAVPAVFSLVFRAFGLGYRSKTRFALGLAVYVAYIAIVPGLIIFLIGYGKFTHIAAPVLIIGGLSVFFFTTDTALKTIFLMLTQSIMTTVISAVLSMVRTILGLSYLELLLMILVACSILFCVAMRFWAKPLRFMVDNVNHSMGALLAVPIATLIVVNLIPIYPPQSFAQYPIYCTFMMLAVELSFFLYVYTLYRNLHRISVLSKEELKATLLQTEASAYQEFLNSARQNRHDLRHHDAILLEQLETGDIDGAKEYLRAHDKAVKEASIRLFCHNATANAALRLYERKAQEADVHFSAVTVIPAELSMTTPEIGGLLSNLLENALTACKKCSVIDRYIALSASVEEESLLIELRNTAPIGTLFRNGLPLSQKPGGGTGTRSIVSTVKSHGGMVEFYQKGAEFFTRIILPL